MRWLALHLPLLPLELFSRGIEPGLPQALAETRRGARRIRLCNAAALERGVRGGMAVAAARALADDLCVHLHDPQREQAALHALAAWAGQFTPNVVPEPPRGLLLDVAASLRLFGGAELLRAAVRSGLEGLGYQALLAQAPTPGGAMLLARTGQESLVNDRAELRRRLAPIPLHQFPCPASQRRALGQIGLNTLGDLFRLPADALARRLGAEFVHRLAQLLGDAPDLRPPFAPPPRFEQALELPFPVEQSDALLFAMRRLLVELGGFLTARGLGVQTLQWRLDHDAPPATAFELGFCAAERNPARMQELLRERLHRLELRAPVQRIHLAAGTPIPLAPALASLFGDQERRERDGARLLERLRARLGSEAVQGLKLNADHRPERAVAGGEPGAPQPALPVPAAPRPLWLLAEPLPLEERAGRPWHRGPLTLAPERERIESGWWDGGEIARDYFVAQDRDGTRLWVYRDLNPPGGWFLHGMF